jgi:FkbM family methyltransferase
VSSSSQGFEDAQGTKWNSPAPQTSHERLKAHIKDLYLRLQAGALAGADLIPISDVKFRDEGHAIGVCVEEGSTLKRALGNFVPTNDLFRSAFGYFIPTYDIFRVFGKTQVVLDVGAHSGYSALAMVQNGCKAKIVSVDAMPANIAALAVVKKSLGSQYDYVHQAISDGPGNLRLYLPVINGYGLTGLASTGGSLTVTPTYDGYADHFAREAAQYPKAPENAHDVAQIALIDIACACLDDVFEARGNEVERIAAFKLDLEGHEGPALRGAKRIFQRTKPLLMVEEANRNPAVVAAMTDYGYFHCERDEGKLVPHTHQSLMNDGFWVHPERVNEYRQLGIFSGEIPTT